MQKKNTLHNLFLIIQSMTREEKRYFKLYLKGLGKKEGHQSKLFDLISKQEEFEETAIKKKLQTTFPSQNKSALQINTYQNILRCLNLFYTNTYAETKVLELLKTIKLLYTKNLFTLVLPEIEKAKKLALEHKCITLLPQILFWDFKVRGQAFSFNNTSKEQLEDKFEEFELILEQIQNFYTYTKSWTKFYIYVRHYFGNNTTKHSSTNPDFIQHLPPPNNLHALLLDNKTKSLQAYISNDYDTSVTFTIKSLQALEESSKVIKEYFAEYLSCLYRIIGNSIARKNWEMSQQYLKKLETLPSDFWTIATYAIYYELLFHYGFRSGDLNRTQATSKLSKKLLAENKPQLNFTVQRDQSIAIAVNAFYHQDYDECIDYLTALEALKYEDINMQNTIKIMLMLAYYEKKEYLLLPSIIRSNYRFFKKDGPRKSFGYTITQALNKASKTIDEAKKVQIFSALKKELTLHHNSYYNGTLMFFDIRVWLHSKIHNLDIAKSLIEFRDKDLIN